MAVINPDVLQHLENALATGFEYHRQLDNFLIQSGVDRRQLDEARRKAEARNVKYEKAPKRYVVQDLLEVLSACGNDGIEQLTNIASNVAKSEVVQQSPSKLALMKLLKDVREEKQSTEREKRLWLIEKQRKEAEEKIRIKRDQAREDLKQRYLGMLSSDDNPHSRGRNLEILMKELLEIEGLVPKHSIKRTGEEVDITFEVNGQTYFLEARWKKEKSDSKEVRDFVGKCEHIHVDARGVFLSIVGFTVGAAEVPRKGESRIILIDGTHIMNVLNGATAFGEMLSQMVRKACETTKMYFPGSEYLN